MSDDGRPEAFLDRWSRRKQEHAQQAATPPAAPAPAAESRPAASLPPVESLKPESDFTPFMAKDVGPETRREALKRLFTDAHYNVPDPFEPFSGDFTVGETIPEEMLKNLNHAKRLLFDETKKPAEAQATVEARGSAQPRSPEPEPKDVAGKQDA